MEKVKPPQWDQIHKLSLSQQGDHMTLQFLLWNTRLYYRKFLLFFLHFGIEWQGKFWPYFDIRSPRFWTIRLIFFSWLQHYFYGDDGFTPTDPNDTIMISNDATFSHKIVISFEWQKIIIWKYILWLALYSVWGKGYFRNLFLTYLISLPVCKRKSISYISDWTCSTIL